jgi:hypothetical protein
MISGGIYRNITPMIPINPKKAVISTARTGSRNVNRNEITVTQTPKTPRNAFVIFEKARTPSNMKK